MIFGFYMQYMPETQFGMKCTRVYSPDKTKSQEYSRNLPGPVYLFSRIDLNNANMNNLVLYTRV